MAGAETEGDMTPEQAIDRIELANRPRAQDRRLHARGAVYDARYCPVDSGVAKLTTARHLLSESAAVIRFSNGSPNAQADDRTRGVRGMAVKFLDDEQQAVADLVAANFRVFSSRTPEGFVELTEILGLSRGGPLARLDALGRLGKLVFKRPESRAALKRFGSQGIPASFATTRYDGLHAFFLVGSDETRTPFRYRLIPHLGEVDLEPTSAATLPPDFLICELDSRLTAGPVVFTLVLQIGESSDDVNDASKAWPESRPLLPTGYVTVTGRAADERRWQRDVFDPTRVPTGVELSDDPILRFRKHAYSISFARRSSAVTEN